MEDDNPAHGPSIDLSVKRRMPEFVIGAAILVAFISLTTLQVVTRYVLESPLHWTEELMSYLLVWMVLVGAVGVHRTDSHIRVEMLDEILPPRALVVLRLVFDVLVLATLVVLAVSGYRLFQSMRFDKLPALRWPIRNLLVIVPTASAMMSVVTLAHIWKRLKLLAG